MSATIPTTTVSAVTEKHGPLLWNELWSSFASLLRSYCAAHGLNSEHQAILEVSTNEIMVRVKTKSLTLLQVEGKGHITFSNGTQTPLELHEDGRVTIGGVTEEMDMAAEHLAREILQ
jgi:hypothetical protein